MMSAPIKIKFGSVSIPNLGQNDYFVLQPGPMVFYRGQGVPPASFGAQQQGEEHQQKTQHTRGDEQKTQHTRGDEQQTQQTRGNLKTLTQERPHDCPHCDASYTENHVLTRHIKVIHLDVKPYSCQDCDYSTARKCALTRHRQAVHRGVRNFACTQCSFTSTTSSHLRVHMRIHTGDFFQCPSCEYKTPRRSNLNSHIKRQHS